MINNFSSLNKSVKDSIIRELRDRAEILCAIIEALFYYVRIVDTENYYKGMNSDEIIEEYETIIKKVAKEVSFSVEGPFADSIAKSSLAEDSRTAFWNCEKDVKKFTIQATISPKELQSEENVGGTTGLKFSLILSGEKLPEKDYNFFNTNELGSRVKLYLRK